MQTPILKKEKGGRSRNYSSANFTLIPGKVKEQISLKITSRPIKDKKVISYSQYVFMKEKSGLTNLIAFYNEMIHVADEGRTADVVYLEFSEAFSTVPYDILTEKLTEVRAR